MNRNWFNYEMYQHQQFCLGPTCCGSSRPCMWNTSCSKMDHALELADWRSSWNVEPKDCSCCGLHGSCCEGCPKVLRVGSGTGTEPSGPSPECEMPRYDNRHVRYVFSRRWRHSRNTVPRSARRHRRRNLGRNAAWILGLRRCRPASQCRLHKGHISPTFPRPPTQPKIVRSWVPSPRLQLPVSTILASTPTACNACVW